jgi:glycosyltransferase involved in cell wall biosynthesis
MASLPRITIVTPSMNQGDFLEQTILSVLSQNYPNLEYIIIDGGSNDNSIEIINKYQRYLAYWISQKDAGQADAIAKGFAHATGDILAWLNSDDEYMPGTLDKIGGYFSQNPQTDLVYGDYFLLFPDGLRKLKKKIDFDFSIALYAYNMITQPSAFWRRKIYDTSGGLDISLHYAMDYDLFLRMAKVGLIKHLREPLSVYRLHAKSKTVANAHRFSDENLIVRAKHIPEPALRSRRFRLKQRLFLMKAVWLFLWQRGVIAIKKEKGKA